MKKEQAMLRVGLVMLALVFSADAALAQWGSPYYGRSPYRQAAAAGQLLLPVRWMGR